jgi:cation diffusion facilitator family transporter
VAIACSVIGAVAKFTVGFLTGSMSMISSAVDSLGDLFVSITNLFVVRYADTEPDDDHNYGHAKVEGLGAMFEGGFIFAAGAFIIYEAIHKALHGEAAQNSTLGIITMLPLLAMTTGTVIYLRRVAKQTGSLVLQTDALHYFTDVWVNIGVLVSLVLVKLTGRPIIDSIISAAIALFMIGSSLRVVQAGFDVIMDKSLEPALVEKLSACFSSIRGIESFHDLRTRGGKIPHVDVHVVVQPTMTALELHDLFEELRRQVRVVVGPTTHVFMHADPAGHSDSADT